MDDSEKTPQPETISKAEYDKLLAQMQAKEAGYSGALKQHQAKVGELEAQLKAALDEHATVLTQLESLRTQHMQAQESLKELEALKHKTERLERLANYPGVLSNEGLRQLAISSTLPLEDLAKILEGIQSSLTTSVPTTSAQPEPQKASDLGMPEPTGGNFSTGPTRESLIALQAEALANGNFDEVNRISQELYKMLGK